MSKRIDLLDDKNIFLNDISGIIQKLDNHPDESYRIKSYTEMLEEREQILNDNRDYYFKQIKKTM